MRNAFLIVLIAAVGYSCQKERPKKLDINTGKHQLSESDPRQWSTYPTLLLVATKHHIGIDTLAQVIKQFDDRFEGLGYDFEVQMPSTSNQYQEDTRPIEEDEEFLSAIGQRVKRSPAEVATIISDFYLIGGANRDFPESTSN